jgi:hypothetical protein
MWKTVWTDADWIAHVRMSESTFVWLKAKLRPHLKMNTKFGRKAKSVGQQLAYALYHLASGCSMAVAAAALQTSKSTVHRCVHRVCDALVRELANQYICFPSTKAAMTRAASVFTQLGQGKGGTPNGLPQIIGAVDGTHIALRDPGKATNDPSWFNRKGYASKNVHAMCDGKGQFIHIAVGAKGSAHDSRVFKSMDLWEDITTGDLGKVMWDNSVNINGIRVPFCSAPCPLRGCCCMCPRSHVRAHPVPKRRDVTVHAWLQLASFASPALVGLFFVAVFGLAPLDPLGARGCHV